MKLYRLLEEVEKILPGRRKDLEILISHLLKIKPSQIHLQREREISKEVESEYLNLVERLKEDVPVEYITGICYFMDLELRIKEGILIPRPETELLVERVLNTIGNDFKGTGLDIGGGTGCISVALLKKRRNLVMYSNDINPEAVEIMKLNAKLHGVEYRFKCEAGNVFNPFEYMVFDFVVSNPPYIPRRKWYYLDEKVKKEGYNSLIGGEEGTEIYKLIAEGINGVLKRHGFLALEIGHDQGDFVKNLLENKGFMVEIYKDYNYQDRIVIAWKL